MATTTAQESTYNPYNKANVEITVGEVKAILRSYGLPEVVNNIALYRRAFVHHSYLLPAAAVEEGQKSRYAKLVECPKDCMPLKSKSNERLEFVGDGVLELITKYYLYRRFPKANEGFMTEKKIAIVKNESIGRICHSMGLQRWLIISSYEEEKGGRTNGRMMGCLFEAFIGALFLDMNKEELPATGVVVPAGSLGPGFQMAQRFVESVLERHIDWTALITQADNYKTILQEQLQKAFGMTPHYLDMGASTDMEGGEGFRMGVYLCLGQSIHSMQIEQAEPLPKAIKSIGALVDYVRQQPGERVFICLGEGVGGLKRKAEQAACNMALVNLGCYIGQHKIF